MKKHNAGLVILILSLTLGFITGCSNKGATANTSENSSSDQKKVTIKGIADLVPHSELIKYVTPKLAEQGIIVELVATSADTTTNEKLAKGEIDFNYFQHEPYLQEWNKANGYDLVNAGDIHVEPITAYSDKYSSKEDIPDNAVVAVPNDGTNEYRALRILEENGFIKLNAKTANSLSASVSDIEKYLRPIKIVELDSAQIIPTKDDYDFFITNTNKALEAKITSKRLFSEGSDSPYANIIAVRKEDVNNPAIVALVKALQSEDTRKYIEKTYGGAVIPAKLDK
ncbi:ABC-type metal ion transport system, periplasmic component/surface antigen [[Clostridium] cellulosi]|jgi:NLPA lipoprotein.|uniref:Lipoprotein n=1 Tax=[Clostridium] cellulosi TaxID=29343 RepID=A0A078KS56_9FIRM|nr:MAG: metal ABC transporter substrate-binding protein [[Clostridium] cellulosi]CDZ23970.1 ABC-type metal ion transport system, periplasmic component/surface antigen [[Clostridium] cellulosi]